jgi:hypothetical protein
MSGLFVFVASPPQGSIVGRSMQLFGSVSGAGSGRVNWVQIQFGVGGPKVTPGGRESWGWQGLIPNNIRPGQAFQIIVTAAGRIQTKPGPEPEFEDVDGEAVLNVVLENVVPVLTVDAFRSPVVVTQLPHPFSFGGTVWEGTGAPYGVPQVQVQIDNSPFADVAVSAGRWSVSPPLQPGDHTLTVRASDAFASVTTIQTSVSVLRFSMPTVIDPALPKTLQGVPTTSSITSWTRLEPQCADADIGATTNARLFDPLWLMTRQWQIGEFQGEDTGSPVLARVRATNATLTRCHFGELSAGNIAAQAYDPARAPLEALVERRRMRATDGNDSRMLTLAVEAGLHFLRMLELNAIAKKYRPAFLAKYAMQALSAQAAAVADEATLRLVRTSAGRAPDARLLASAFRHPTTVQIVFDPSLNITTADAGAVGQIATAWLIWYDGLFAEPANAADDAWTPSRLEYAVSVSTRLSAQPQDAMTLSATEFGGGRLDWSSFDINAKFKMDTTGDHSFAPINEVTIPAPVTFRGTPAARFWELEDAKVAYGLLPAGPTDLAHLLMIEYASSYGNDWYVVPLTVPVGSLTRVDSLVITDTFGVRSLLRAIGDPALPKPYFSMWQQSNIRYAGDPIGVPVSNRFFLPPTIGRSIDGTALEDVLLMRDEMANLAWGIERSIEGPVETSLPIANGSATTGLAPAAASSALPRYLLSSTVPDNWIPLLPVQLDTKGTMRLKRGAVLQPDGSSKVHQARSEVLNAAPGLLLYDEEIPREGANITRRRRMTRWIDGSTWVWTSFRNEVGRGEGSAGLRFDELDDH